MDLDQFSQFDHVATPIFVIHPGDDGLPRFAYMNKRVLDTCRFTMDQIVGKTVLDLFPDRFGRVVYARHVAAMDLAEPVTYEFELPLPEGTLWFETHFVPVKDANGTLTHIVGTSQDTTALQTARELMAQTQTQNAEREHFVALAAHDLRAPMRHVGFIAEVLQEDFVDMGDGKVELVGQLQEIADSAADLISDVLKHAQSSSLLPDDKSFDLHELCENITSVLDPQGDHHIAWPTCRIQTDRTALQIVLRNLIDNAIKHGARDSLTISISLRTTCDLPDFIEMRLSDNGCGFRHPETIFDKIGGGHGSGGFGLLGIKKLIRARHGQIWAQNTAMGQGGSVSFRLPGKILSQFADPLAIQTNVTRTA